MKFPLNTTQIRYAAIGSSLLILILLILAMTSPRSEARKPSLPLNFQLENADSDFEGMERMDREIANFMQYWHLHGLQLTVMRNDSLLFSKGYGQADGKIAMTPKHILRVASVSKLITATGIMKLQEEGLLHLQDKVFGESGILSGESYAQVIRDSRYAKISVEDLLRHKAGFVAGANDPLFSRLNIMKANGLTAPPDNETLLRIVLKRNLGYDPGSRQQYSNLGYLLLSQVIEVCSGESYEAYIRKHVLEPAGCYDFVIASNYYRDKALNEVRYYLTDKDEDVEEYNGSGRKVQRCYGGNDITGLSGAGAWVCSTAELARLVASIDGKPGVADILSEESVRQMTEYFDEDTYSLGWNDTHPEKGWTRTGTLSGTSALIKYFPDGECWILVTNTSTWKGPRFTRYTAELFDKLRSRFSDRLPKQDLFSQQEQQ